MRYTVFFLLSFCLGTYKASANPFSSIKDKALLVAGGLVQKKEHDEFARYRKHPLYSTYFNFPITSVQEFKVVLDQYAEQLKNWNAQNVYTLNEQVPTLYATVEEPRLFARAYSLIEFMLKQVSEVSPAGRERVSSFLKQCQLKSAATAEREIKEGKDFQASEYLFLSVNCSREAHSILKSEQKNINTFLSYALTPKSQTAPSNFPLPTTNKSEEKPPNNSPLFLLRQKCAANITPDCSTIVRSIYYNIEQHPLTLMLYGKGLHFPTILLDEETTNLFKSCSDSKNFTDQRCQQFAQKIAQTWQTLDPEQKFDLTPNLQSYFLGHEELLNQTFSGSDFKGQVAFDNYTGYKNIEDIFKHLYAMSCSIDVTFRIRLSPLENATFVEQQIALSDSKLAQNARTAISSVSDKIQSLAKSNNAITSKVGSTGENLLSVNSSISITENEDIFLAPDFINYYIQDWVNLKDKDIQISSTESIKFESLVKGLKPVSKKLLKDNGITVDVDYATLFGVLSKICISILGPEYLKAENDISKALQEQNEQIFQNSINDVMTQLKSEPSKKDSRAFRYLPSNEYNKLKQIALIILTNIHVILLDDRLKKQGKESPFHVVADQIRQAFGKQLHFFARYIYALKFERYDSNSLSMSPFNASFIESFIKCIYPVSDSDLSTLVDADGTNMYSLYSSYLVGSIYGVIDDTGERNISLDNRSAKNKFIGNFKKTFGLEAELSINSALKGGINTALQALTPIPSILTSVIASGATTALMVGPEQVYRVMRNSCRFNKDKCIAMELKKVDLTRPLDTRITEFLMAFGNGLQNQIKINHNAPRTRNFDPIMPTLFVLENEDRVKSDSAKRLPLNQPHDILQALILRTNNYYESLNQSYTQPASEFGNSSHDFIDLTGLNGGSEENVSSSAFANKQTTTSPTDIPVIPVFG
jgi:hypothetical protein